APRLAAVRVRYGDGRAVSEAAAAAARVSPAARSWCFLDEPAGGRRDAHALFARRVGGGREVGRGAARSGAIAGHGEVRAGRLDSAALIRRVGRVVVVDRFAEGGLRRLGLPSALTRTRALSRRSA